MQDKYVCAICGSTHYDLGQYVNCVIKCSEKLKRLEEEEKEKKRLEELNAALNKVKQAQIYFEQQLNEFKEKYPTEYELNFAKNGNDSCSCDSTSVCSKCGKGDGKTEAYNKPSDFYQTVEIEVKDDGKGNPTIDAKINGEKVEDEQLKKLLDDPETQFIAKMLGL